MIKTKADLVVAGFTHLEGVYKETIQTQQELSARTLATVAGR
jgi:hypothetical protein